MKDYIDLVLKKSKKTLSIEEIIGRVEELINKRSGSIRHLSSEDLRKIKKVLVDGINSYDYYSTSNGMIKPLYKTSFRKGNFFVKKKGSEVEYKVYTTCECIRKNGQRYYENIIYTIDKDLINGAIDGDSVLIEQINDENKFSKKAKVEKILDRKIESVVGEVYRVDSNYFVKPLDKRKQGIYFSIDGPAVEGQIVSVNLKEQTGDNFFIGEIERVYNREDDPDEDVLLEAFKQGVPDGFSKESNIELSRIPSDVTPEEKGNGRVDHTSLRTYTIDSDETKDLDDALSYYEENGYKVVVVQIADVGHYVPIGSALFKDAYTKGNSYYVAGRVIPMLPHELSSGICSLKPAKERLTISTKMVFDENGDIIDDDIYLSYIKSDMKMTYKNVNKLLKGEEYPKEYEEFSYDLHSLCDLALLRRAKRISNGSIEFNKPELKIVYDENGKAVDFKVREQDLAEIIVEEFMIAANTTVSRLFSNLNLPCLYRVHDKPNRERLGNFLNCLQSIHIPLETYDVDSYSSSQELQNLASEINDYGPLSFALNSGLIKCMSRARYNPENTGHFGLSEEEYLHFTSPIRRFADLVVHNLLYEFYFNKDLSRVEYFKKNLAEFGDQASRMEKVSDDLERVVTNMKCSEYMEHHIGEEYYGTAISLSEKCILVQLDNLIEGRVSTKSLPGYKYDKTHHVLEAIDGSDYFNMGDRLKLVVVGASKEDKTIDFNVLEKINCYDEMVTGNGNKVKAMVYSFNQKSS